MHGNVVLMQTEGEKMKTSDLVLQILRSDLEQRNNQRVLSPEEHYIRYGLYYDQMI